MVSVRIMDHLYESFGWSGVFGKITNLPQSINGSPAIQNCTFTPDDSRHINPIMVATGEFFHHDEILGEIVVDRV
ncbi:MAG: hypothetical protein MK102_14825 [Fuerstiella sp.]|nr:hypothetical protein [Fuerstiella sp.]